MPKASRFKTEQLRRQVVVTAVTAVYPLLQPQPSRCAKPIPLHDGRKGEDWVRHLFNHRNPVGFKRAFGVSRPVFTRLVKTLCDLPGEKHLKPTRRMSCEEQVAIFLSIMHLALPNSKVQEDFQRSGSTISMVFHRILDLVTLTSFYTDHVKLPTTDTPTEKQIWGNKKRRDIFKNVVGAVDGTHVPAFCLDGDQRRYHNHKGFLSQNVLAACTFGMLFCYILSGWEGSAADSRVMADARSKDFTIPEGFSFLADAGFPAADGFYIPYRGARYHLKEWAGTKNLLPRNKEELYNLRHASLRNAVERIFGVAQKMWLILNAKREYNYETQRQIPPAVTALHNFVFLYDPNHINIEFGNAREAHRRSLRDKNPAPPAPLNQDELGPGVISKEEKAETE